MNYRLKKKADFDKVFKKGKKVYGKSLLMLYLPSNTLKIGITVSKKHGKAVVRNRIKRLLRAAIRQVVPDLKGNNFIVFLPKVKDNYDYHEYLEDVLRLTAREELKNGSRSNVPHK